MSGTSNSRSGSHTWRSLLRTALRLLDDLAGRGFPPPAWTVGGGTVLMLRHEHRLSRDIDVFLRDAQYMTALSPRLNDRAAEVTADYEETSTALKLVLPDGAIDFIVAPKLTDVPEEVFDFEGRDVLLESSAEILAKKTFYHAESLRLRDAFDLAVVLDREPDVVEPLRRVLGPRLGVLRRRLEDLGSLAGERLRSEVHLLPAGYPHVAHWLDRVRRFAAG